MEKGEEEGTEQEVVVEVVEEEAGGLVELAVPNEEEVRLGNATEEE